MESIADRVAKALKLRMAMAGLSQTALAEKSGLTGATINAFCNGRGKVLAHSLELMAQNLGTTAEALIKEEAPIAAPVTDLAQIVRAAVAEAFAEHERSHVEDPDAAATMREIVQTLSVLNAAEMKNALKIARAFRAEHDAQAEKPQSKKQRSSR
jgi:hypothetical protein